MSLDSREFRNALGCFATGVCVITANREGSEPFGMTVNSFASVSLDPPLILWSLQNNSEMYAAFEKASHFAVNVLTSGQQELSNQYAKKGDHALDPAHYEIGATGVPIMPATSVSFECELETTYPGGDHLILIGRVVEMADRDHGDPLLFCSGSYRELK
jgi:flavin reductase (DIM6/NTAB) family NADH-FMN oxidoreductase RutF